ncbi:MAG: hypothetical protein QXU53_06650 [Thermosphaera sp.]
MDPLKRFESVKTSRFMLGMTIATILVSIAFASVFVYYPAAVNVNPSKPPVVFMEGSNSGGRDLYGAIIEVTLDPTGTSASLTLHPTYQKTYYMDVLRIRNQDPNNAYYVKVKVAETVTRGNLASARIYLYEGSVLVGTVDLLTTQLQPDNWILLNAEGELRMDFEFVYTTQGGSYETPPPGSGSILLELIYSSQNTESPP